METPGTDDAQALAEEAEAEAVAAEAAAAAALARARALKLRRQAEAVAEANRSSAEVDSLQESSDDPDPIAATVPPDPADENLDQTPVDPTRRRQWRRVPRLGLRRVAAALAIVCTVGFIGASGFMIAQHRHVVAEQQRRVEFAAAARQAVVTLMSLDYNDAQNVVKRILDNTTGDFKNDFQSQADEFAKVAQSSKVITEATVNATAVQSMTQDTGTVLVAVTTQVSNAASKEQQPRTWRLRVDMARDDGQLKLAKVEFVP